MIEKKQELEDETIWQDIAKSSAINKKIAMLEKKINDFDTISTKTDELISLWELACDEAEIDLLESISSDIQKLDKQVSISEFERMFTEPMDENNAFLDIQAGSGGTEAQDWAEMLVRMYTKWAESKGFKLAVMDWTVGDVAGIKGASIKIEGAYAFGWLRTETGIHRLVRKSPFDSGNRRHTSFSSVYVTPEIDDTIQVDLNMGDCRIDTYRASGAGGQHVNTTDSAVRIMHIPTSIAVQCQSERSQHQNKAQAIQQLRAKLYEHLLKEQQDQQQAQAQAKDAITWGRQIRSYVLDQSRIKDLRTGYESGNTQAILDGNLDGFIKASLVAGVGIDKTREE